MTALTDYLLEGQAKFWYAYKTAKTENISLLEIFTISNRKRVIQRKCEKVVGGGDGKLISCLTC